MLYEGHPDGAIELLYYPNSHAYKVNGEKLIGVSGVLDVLNKEGLKFYYMNEALKSIKRSLDPENKNEFRAPTLDEWNDFVKKAKKAHEAKSDRGKDNGTATHEWIEKFLIAKRDGKETPPLPEMKDVPKDSVSYEEIDDIEVRVEYNNLIEALSQFIDWYETHDIEVVELERVVYSRRYKYAGRFDAILRIDGKLYLIDFKTNNPSADYPKGVFPDMNCQLGGYDVAYTEEFYPELDEKNQSCFDGHAIFNFSKKTGKFNKHFVTGDEARLNRTWFVHTIGAKRAQQHHVRNLSMRYKENRNKG